MLLTKPFINFFSVIDKYISFFFIKNHTKVLPKNAIPYIQHHSKEFFSRQAKVQHHCDNGELHHYPRYTGDLPATYLCLASWVRIQNMCRGYQQQKGATSAIYNNIYLDYQTSW